MDLEQYTMTVPGQNLFSYIFSGKHRWMLNGSIIRKNEPACFAETAESSCFLFAGGNGYGKNTMIESFAGSACGDNDYKYYRIPADVFFDSADRSPLEVMSELFLSMENTFFVKESFKKVFVYFENIMYITKYDSLNRMFVNSIQRIMKKKGAHLIFALSCGMDAKNIPSVYKTFMQVIAVQLPDKIRREDLISDRFEGLRKIYSGFPLDELVMETEGLSYGELDRLIKNIHMVVKGKYLDDMEKEEFSGEGITIDPDFLPFDAYRSIIADIIKSRTEDEKESSSVSGSDLADAFSDVIRFRSASVSYISDSPVAGSINEKAYDINNDAEMKDAIDATTRQMIDEENQKMYNENDIDKLLNMELPSF